MKISLHWIDKYTDITIPKDELVAKIGEQVGAVENVIDWGARYKDVIVAKVVKVEQHPDADKLKVLEIDDGKASKNVERLENGNVQVVCGAPNAREGLTVAWIAPGATIPSTFDMQKPVVLEAIKLRGVLSNGMIGSPQELVLSDDHTGILEIDEDVKPGTAFSELYGLNDTIVEIENKMFTHRPDGFGQLGVAREIAGIQGVQFASPDWYHESAEVKAGDSSLQVSVRNEIPELAPRYMAVAIDNVTIKPSPMWLQSTLKRVGIRPINNAVDITNYMMMLTAQPLHAFDFDKVANGDSATIVVRKPQAGEKLTLLDGKEIEPHADAVLIANEEKSLALGGAMGGANSEIDENTTRIILECASFDMYNIRKTSMIHGIFTDAVTRFNKGQSPAQCAAVLVQAVEMLKELAGGQIASQVADDYPDPFANQPVRVTTDFVNERLGSAFTAQQMAAMLQNVEFSVDVNGDELSVTAPFWRTDIAIAEDLVEEVGRMHGFNELPIVLPKRDLTPASAEPMMAFKNKLRQLLARAGANEVLTYSFVHGNLLGKSEQNAESAFKVRNALSPDLQHYRLSLTPSLLEKVHQNVKQGFREFALFELNKVHQKDRLDKNDSDLPLEAARLGLVVIADDKAAVSHAGAAYYQAKYLLDYVGSRLGLEFVYQPLHDVGTHDQQKTAPFEPKRSALVKIGDDIIGVVGEYKTSVKKAFKLPEFSAGFEINTELLLEHTKQTGTTYKPLSTFPGTEQDVCFAVQKDVDYGQLYQIVSKALRGQKDLQVTVSPLDIYQRDDDPEHKQITLRISLQHMQKTLTAEEINGLVTDLSQKVTNTIDAVRV